MEIIFLESSQGKIRGETSVDTEDFKRFSNFKWRLLTPTNYVVRSQTTNGKKKVLLLHREIMSAPEGMTVDHINGNRLDNTKSNLRLATIAENTRNRGAQKNNTSGYKGVFRKSLSCRGKEWRARLNFKKQTINLGSFDSAKEAAIAYNKASLKFHGEFAYLNKI